MLYLVLVSSCMVFNMLFLFITGRYWNKTSSSGGTVDDVRSIQTAWRCQQKTDGGSCHAEYRQGDKVVLWLAVALGVHPVICSIKVTACRIQTWWHMVSGLAVSLA